MNEPRSSLTRQEVQDWLTRYVAQLLGMDRQQVDPTRSLELYGIDSSGAVGMSGDLADLLGCEFETSLVYDYPTIDSLRPEAETE